jgi:hypothetical protein
VQWLDVQLRLSNSGNQWMRCDAFGEQFSQSLWVKSFFESFG